MAPRFTIGFRAMIRRSRLLPVLGCVAFVLNGFAAAPSPLAAAPMQADEPPCHTVADSQAPVPVTPLDGGHDCCSTAPCHCATAHLPALILSWAANRAVRTLLTSAPPRQIALCAPTLPDPIRPPIV